MVSASCARAPLRCARTWWKLAFLRLVPCKIAESSVAPVVCGKRCAGGVKLCAYRRIGLRDEGLFCSAQRETRARDMDGLEHVTRPSVTRHMTCLVVYMCKGLVSDESPP